MPAKADSAELWLQAPPSRLAPKEQLRAVALRDAMQEFGDDSANYQRIANKLTVGGEGSPSREVVRLLLNRVDEDSDWYPGKSYQAKHGPAPLLSPAKCRAIATSMMAAKKRGHEPSTALAVHLCPTATSNPVTNATFTPKYIRKVFLEDCYDVPPEPLAIPALLAEDMAAACVASATLSMGEARTGNSAPCCLVLQQLDLV